MSDDAETSSEDDKTDFPLTDLTKLRRLPKRGSRLHADVYRILDATPVCHVGYIVEDRPIVTPTLHWRKGNVVFWHGSIASRFLKRVAGTPVCLTCTLIDGYVLARSAFNHTVNYRSVMVFGKARVVVDRDAKENALRDLMDGMFSNRWETLRAMDDAEINATAVLCLEIEEATVKSRAGPPGDSEEASIPVWSGVIPITTTLATPEPAPELPEATALPSELLTLVRSGRLQQR